MLFWKKKKIVYREPHIYNNIPRTGKYKYNLWRTLDAMHFTSVHIELWWYGQDSCDGYNHLNNEWNKPKFVEWGSINLRDVLSYFIVDVLLWK